MLISALRKRNLDLKDGEASFIKAIDADRVDVLCNDIVIPDLTSA